MSTSVIPLVQFDDESFSSRNPEDRISKFAQYGTYRAIKSNTWKLNTLLLAKQYELQEIAREQEIPKLAQRALSKAYTQALASGAKILEVVNDQVVETAADGSVRILKDLPTSQVVVAGTKKRLRIQKR